MVDGLRSTSIQKRLLSGGDIPLSKAYGIAISLETANKEASGMQALPSDAVKQVVHVPPAQKPPCYRCGKPGHSPDQCYYKKLICRACGKRGHIARACKNPNSNGERKPGKFKGRRQHRGFRGHKQHHIDEVDSRTPSPESLFNIRTVKGFAEHSIKVDVHVDSGTRHRSCVYDYFERDVETTIPDDGPGRGGSTTGHIHR